jgi:uncharacterized protein
MKTKPFLTTTWSHLAMMNYEVDPEILNPFVPCGTELDTFEGKHFVSIVGFLYCDTRVMGLSVPGYRDFAEVNLRFYIRYRAPDGWRRGVAFIKEIVPLRAVALVARKLYDENFVMRPMRHTIEPNQLDSALPPRVEYSWKEGHAWHGLQLTTTGLAANPAHGSEAEFITEHYWGYTARRDGSTSEYRVEHPPWRVIPALNANFDCDVATVYGSQFVDSLQETPCSAFLAEGSAVAVYPGRKL